RGLGESRCGRPVRRESRRGRHTTGSHRGDLPDRPVDVRVHESVGPVGAHDHQHERDADLRGLRVGQRQRPVQPRGEPSLGLLRGRRRGRARSHRGGHRDPVRSLRTTTRPRPVYDPLAEVAMATGWVYHELYMWHDTGRAAPITADRRWLQAWEHYENPETKRRVRDLVEGAGPFHALVPLKPRLATVDELLRFHTPAYVGSIRAMSASTGGNAGEGTPFGPGSFEIALLAAGGTITAVDAVLDGRVRNAYALVRPPGH